MDEVHNFTVKSSVHDQDMKDMPFKSWLRSIPQKSLNYVLTATHFTDSQRMKTWFKSTKKFTIKSFLSLIDVIMYLFSKNFRPEIKVIHLSLESIEPVHKYTHKYQFTK